MRAAFATTPLSIAQLVDEPMFFLRKHLKVWMRLALPMGLINAAVGLPGALVSPLFQGGGTLGTLAGIALIPAVGLGMSIGLIWSLVSSVMAVRAVYAMRAGEEPQFGKLLRDSIRGPLLGVAGAKTFMTLFLTVFTCGLALLVLPFAWSHALSLAEAEQVTALDALGRSWAQVRGRRSADGKVRWRIGRPILMWHVIGAVWTSLSSAAMMPVALASMFVAFRAAADGGTPDMAIIQWISVLFGVANNLLTGFAALFMATLFTHLYDDLSRQVDGRDLRAALDERLATPETPVG